MSNHLTDTIRAPHLTTSLAAWRHAWVRHVERELRRALIFWAISAALSVVALFAFVWQIAATTTEGHFGICWRLLTHCRRWGCTPLWNPGAEQVGPLWLAGMLLPWLVWRRRKIPTPGGPQALGPYRTPATSRTAGDHRRADPSLRRVRSVVVAMACASLMLACAAMDPADFVGPPGDWFGGPPPLLCFELVAILNVAVAAVTVLAPLLYTRATCNGRSSRGS